MFKCSLLDVYLCPHLTYIDCLKYFGLKSLEGRRIMFDLCEMFHVIHVHNYHKLNNHFLFTHSLRFQLNFSLVYCCTEFQKHFWFFRVIHYWNFLSYKVKCVSVFNMLQNLKVLLLILILMSFLKGMPMHRALLIKLFCFVHSVVF